MIVLFYIVTIACFMTGHFEYITLANSKPFTSPGSDIWWVWPFLAGLPVRRWHVRPDTRRAWFIAEMPQPSWASPRSSFPIPVLPSTARHLPVLRLTPSSSFIGSFLGDLVAMALMVAYS